MWNIFPFEENLNLTLFGSGMSLQILGYFVSVNYYCHAKFMLTYCSSQTSGKHLQSFHFDGLFRRVQATAMGQALLKARWLRAVPGNSDDVFKDENLFYSLWQVMCFSSIFNHDHSISDILE